jgi:hypothetical protein
MLYGTYAISQLCRSDRLGVEMIASSLPQGR